MEEKINELEDKVIELENRLYALERHEATHKIGKLIKLLVTIFIVLAIAYGGIKAYDYVTNELPKLIDQKVTDVKNNITKNGN